MLTLKELVELQKDIPPEMVLVGRKRNTKLMFHKAEKSRAKYNPKFYRAAFEEYQKEHWNNFFVGTEFILSFWYEGKSARFVGCYRCNREERSMVNDKGNSRDMVRFPEMMKIDFMQEFGDRLFIEWTNPTANYGRFLEDDKYFVHSIHPSKDHSIGALPKNFFQIHLPYNVLVKLFEYPNDNPEWQSYLKSRCGVYYVDDLSDPENGRYVGSAYGEQGFWGRWENYSTKTDGNKDFKGRDYVPFVFSILWETLPNTPKDSVVAVESQFKESLGTRVKGLNNN